MRVVLINVEALTDQRSELLPECSPLIDGKFLWSGLSKTYTLITYSRQDEEKVKYWLDREGFVQGINHYTLDQDESIASMIDMLRARGHDIQMLLSHKTAELDDAITCGCVGLLLFTPAYLRKEWAEDTAPIQLWDRVVAGVEQRRMALASDQRLAEKDL